MVVQARNQAYTAKLWAAAQLLDPVEVVEEGGVVTLGVVRELLGRTLRRDVLCEHPLPTAVDDLPR